MAILLQHDAARRGVEDLARAGLAGHLQVAQARTRRLGQAAGGFARQRILRRALAGQALGDAQLLAGRIAVPGCRR
jgi:hypothetical protein